MALTHYLCQVDNALDPCGPLSQAIPHVVIGEINSRAAGNQQKRERGLYLSLTAVEKAQVASASLVASHARFDTAALHR